MLNSYTMGKIHYKLASEAECVIEISAEDCSPVISRKSNLIAATLIIKIC